MNTAARAQDLFKSSGPTLVHRNDDVHSTFSDDRSIGDIIRATKNLSDEQVESILVHQKEHGVRFGEAAVALGLASDADVVFALSQQFHYPYAPDHTRELRQELVVSTQPFGRQAEAFRAIRSQLMIRAFNPSEPKRALAVVSADHGDGKTFFVANLGIALAQMGGRTLIVDADFRRPRLHQVFGIPNTSGLSGILSSRQEENVIFQAPDISGLYVMPVGVTPPNPLELLERPAFRLLLGELMRKFDHVVVDTPAASVGSDALVIAAKCGSALLVASKDKTKAKNLQALTASVAAATARIAGVVMNDFGL
jgi:chain length determinant protein tyrosine kinase EpsG